ncbi:MAG: S24 family peptidase [Candidatus Solibacter usitatus]|nr:S24 family peptidase [Candidatus Solibacter usitatus]
MFEALGESCGVMLTDHSTGDCVFRFRRDWEDFAGAEAEVLAAICEDLPEKQREMGTHAFLEWIDTSLSGTFRVEPPAQTICADLERTAQALYRRLVKSTVREYKTHLPLIPIDLAAGKLGQDRATGVKEWIEAEVPGRRALSEDLFIVRIRGRSMEPDIPDGSLCVFRSYYGGSRTGGIYIVQRIATHDEGGEFTIKRYASRKKQSGDEWEHEQIHMRPDNPEFEAWDLKEEDRYVTIAEFVSVLEDPVA